MHVIAAGRLPEAAYVCATIAGHRNQAQQQDEDGRRHVDEIIKSTPVPGHCLNSIGIAQHGKAVQGYTALDGMLN